MDMTKLKGREFYQKTSGYQDADGFWHLEVSIIERVTEDGEKWIEEEIKASSMDRDFHNAHKLAMFPALQELQRLVYNAGYDSMIEAREAERQVENVGSDDSQDTPTQ